MVTDPIGDLIIQLKNASTAGKQFIAVPYSKLKFAIVSKLQHSGYTKLVSKRGKKAKKSIEIELLYDKDKKPKISGVSRISKPSRRIYKKASEIFSRGRSVGVMFISTPKGILTGEEARREKTGGEVLFKIW